MSFSLDNKLVFIGSFQSSSSDSLVKSLSENVFKNLSQKFDSEVLDLLKQKRSYPYGHMCDFERTNETLPSKNKFLISLGGKRISDEKYQHIFKVWNEFAMNKFED